MPIRVLTTELVHDIIESYGQITKLNLSTNEISRVENLERLTCLAKLDLFCNRLGTEPGSLDGLAPLTRLRELVIADNSITSLRPLSLASVTLERLDASNNAVAAVDEVDHLAPLTALTELVLAGNPLSAHKEYRSRTLKTLSSLEALDHTPRQHRGSADGEGQNQRVRASDAGNTPGQNWGENRRVSLIDTVQPVQPCGAGVQVPSVRDGGEAARGKTDRVVEVSPQDRCPPIGDGSKERSEERSNEKASNLIESGREGFERHSDAVFQAEHAESGGIHAQARARFHDVSERSTDSPRKRMVAESSYSVSGFFGGDAVGGNLASRKAGLAASEFDSVIAMSRPTLQAPNAVVVNINAADGSSREEATENGFGLIARSTGPFRRTFCRDETTPPGTKRVVDGERGVGIGIGTPESGAADFAAVSLDRSALEGARTQSKTGSFAASSEHGLNASLTDPTPVEASTIAAESTAREERKGSVMPPSGLSESSEASLPGSGTAIPRATGRRGLETTPTEDRSHHVPLDEEGRYFPFRRTPSEYKYEQHVPERKGMSGDGGGGGGDAFLPLPQEGRLSSLPVPTGVALGAARGDGHGHGHDLPMPNASMLEAAVEDVDIDHGGSLLRSMGDRPRLGWTDARDSSASAARALGLKHESGIIISTDCPRAVAGGGIGSTGQASFSLPQQQNNPSTDSQLRFRASFESAAPYESRGLMTADGASRFYPPWHIGVAGRPGSTLQGGTVRGAVASVLLEQWPSSTLRAVRDGSRREGRGLGCGDGVGGKTVTIDRGEMEALLRENDDLRRQASLAEKRCTALTQIQRLADDALSKEYPFTSLSSSSPAPSRTIASRHPGNPMVADRDRGTDVKQTTRSQELSRERSEGRSADGDDLESPRGNSVSKLLACWRREVLKLLLQRAAMVEASEEASRDATRRVCEAREAQSRAEAEVKSLAQRVLAAEAEAELLGIKLRRMSDELRADKAGRQAAEASSSSHAVAVQNLQLWLQGFVGRASEGFFEREALLARGVAKMEAFSQRLGLAAERLEVLGILLKHKEVQLRNSRAALVADRRVWLLERRDREIAALAREPSGGMPPEEPSQRGAGGGMMRRGQAVGDLLEGLRPECEAVMRALFCRVDRLGTGAVRARRLLDVLRSDCGVSELMEAAVGGGRWSAALDAMEAALCPGPDAQTTGSNGVRGCGGNKPSEIDPSSSELEPERDVTWGEFLLFFLPSVGPAADAYNAGILKPLSDSVGSGRTVAGWRPTSEEDNGSRASMRDAGALVGRRGVGFGAVSGDAVALLRMVVPPEWRPRGGDDEVRSRRRGLERGALAALSVGRLRWEALRLARERAFLMALVREEWRMGVKRVEAVHDLYRHELRALHAKGGEVEFSLEQAERRAERQQERAEAVEQEISRLREEMQQAEQAWEKRLEATENAKAVTLAEASREATKAETAARERFSRLEAEHALALRENGKASVRQRALERELARIKTSSETEARLEKEALQERLRDGESKLAVARRERSALLAALRDVQRRGREDAIPSPRRDSARFQLEPDCGRRENCDVDGVEGKVCGEEGVSATEKSSSFAGGLERGARAVERFEEVPEPRASEKASPISRSRGGGVGGAVPRLKPGLPSDEGARGNGGKSASLTARLEMLALQTRQLLAEGSDSSCSDDSDLD